MGANAARAPVAVPTALPPLRRRNPDHACPATDPAPAAATATADPVRCPAVQAGQNPCAKLSTPTTEAGSIPRVRNVFDAPMLPVANRRMSTPAARRPVRSPNGIDLTRYPEKK